MKPKRNNRHPKQKKSPGNGSLSKPLSPAQAHKMAQKESHSEYGPTIRADKAGIRASKQREKDIGQWYGQLANKEAEAASQTDASYADANAAMRANIEAAANAANASNATVLKANTDFAALTGAAPSALAPSTQEAANAAAQRSIAGAALAAPIAAGGANQAAYERNVGINTRHEGIYQRGQETKRRSKMKEDLTALRKERAGKTAERFNERRKEERDYAIQNRAFPLEKEKLKAEAAQDAIDNQQEQEKINETRRHDKAGEHEKGKEGPKARKNALATANTLYEKGTKGGGEWPSWASLMNAVAKESEVSPAAARWAVKKLQRKVEREEKEEAGRTADPNGTSLGH